MGVLIACGLILALSFIGRLVIQAFGLGEQCERIRRK